MNKRHGTHVILGAITPAYDAADAETLSYPHLRSVLKTQNLPSFLRRSGSDLIHKRTDFSPSAMQEDWRSTYLLGVAYRLQKAWSLPEKVFWSTQFTTTSVKLFGKPLSREVMSIARQEIDQFNEIARTYDIDQKFVDHVTNAYASLLSPRAKPIAPLEERYSIILTEIRTLLIDKYHNCFEVFEPYSAHFPLRSKEIASIFASALRTLKTEDSSWNDWEVVMDRSAKLSVNVIKKKIIVGKRRAPLLIGEVRGLFVHEVLVHAKRAVNGATRSHDLTVGLPDYLASEEGLGVLFESAVNGTIPSKVKDRYVDIALALGSWNRRPMARNELYVFCYARAVMRSVAAGDQLDLDLLEKTTWEHINRIYRGSLGNKYIAVFTKDVTYYQGFIKMANYLHKAAKRNALKESLQYVYQGKFDPTNKAHRDYISHL